MEKAKEMKTIRLVEPFYANHLGNGMFAGVSLTFVYQCKKCKMTKETKIPAAPFSAQCVEGGLHIWVKVDSYWS